MTRLMILILVVCALSFAQSAPRLYSQYDGTYLGTLSTNQFAPDSTSNQFGRYGSQFSPDSINNPFGKYGSPFSPYSANNPFATQAPIIVAPPAMPRLQPMPVMPVPRVYAPVMPYSTWPVR